MSNPDAAAMPLREALCRLYPGANTKDNWRFACALAERGDWLQAIAELDRENDIAAIVPLPAWAALAEGLGFEPDITEHDITIVTEDFVIVISESGWTFGWGGIPRIEQESPAATRALVIALLLAAAMKEAAA